MIVLSLFDGISAGQVALERAGIPVEAYYASEIDKYAIQVTQHNYPNTTQLGDVTKWREWDIDWSKIDLLLSGFCCQSWSISGKQQGDKDPRGALMWTMLEVRDHILKVNPKLIWLFENVKMKKEFQVYVNNAIGIEPTLINSSTLSAQNRPRLYWFGKGIPENGKINITQPEDRGLILKDILEPEVDAKYYLSQKLVDGFRRKQERRKDIKSGFDRKINIRGEEQKASCLTARMSKCGITDNYIQKLASLSASERKDIVKNGKAMPENVEITVKEGQFIYTNHLGQNGSLVKDKCATLVCASTPAVVTNDLGIRKLTPKECLRLQTFDDTYFDIEGLSNSQKYKATGNSFTVDVIAHILKHIP